MKFWKFSTAMLKNILLYGYSIKKVWLTEQEFEKYYEGNDNINESTN